MKAINYHYRLTQQENIINIKYVTNRRGGGDLCSALDCDKLMDAVDGTNLLRVILNFSLNLELHSEKFGRVDYAGFVRPVCDFCSVLTFHIFLNPI